MTEEGVALCLAVHAREAWKTSPHVAQQDWEHYKEKFSCRAEDEKACDGQVGFQFKKWGEP